MITWRDTTHFGNYCKSWRSVSHCQRKSYSVLHSLRGRFSHESSTNFFPGANGIIFHVFCCKKRTGERELDRPSLALGPSTVTGNEKRRDLRKSNLEDDFPPTVKLLYVRPLVIGPLNVGPLVLRPLDVRLLIGRPLAVRALDHYQQLGKPLYIKTSQGYKNNPFI